MAVNVSIPKGTRDFGPEEMARRNYIFDTIKTVFRLYGYLPLETPAMENLSTLTGKYGEEGDRLIFKILNSGDYLSGITPDQIAEFSPAKLASRICEKALRYDLTVPFARYVVMNQAKINFPFKRFQIQPVWRADRPQKGRYREFFQCDADIIGSTSLINELELIQIISDVFDRLKIKIEIRINNRKILLGIAEVVGCQDKFMDIVTTLDKLEKIGEQSVIEELISRGIPNDSVDKIMNIAQSFSAKTDVFAQLSESLSGSDTGNAGLSEIKSLLEYCKIAEISDVIFDFTLARGLNYYTGTIIEVRAKEVNIGSICGGGRYDDLTGIFGLSGMSGVGVSFGADRVYDVMHELNIFPEEISGAVKILFVNFGGEDEILALKLLTQFRKSGISAEIFPDNMKLKKQLAWADNRGIPWVVLLGEEERKINSATFRNMKSGEQQSVSLDEILAFTKEIC